jgi:hypothetical protein
VLTAVIGRDNKGTIRGAKRVSGGDKVERAMHGIGGGAICKREPAVGTDKITESSGVEKAAVQSPGRRATSGSSGRKGSSVVVGSGARNGNKKDAQVVGSDEQLNGGKGFQGKAA